MAYGVRSHKFLCCLPVRLGVFVLSFLQLLSAGLVAAGAYAILIENVNIIQIQKFKIITIVLAAVMTLLFIISLLGFIGSIFRRIAFVRIYSTTLNWFLGINFVVGIAVIVLLFVTDNATLIRDCINGSTDQSTIDSCNGLSNNTNKFGTLAAIIINWLIQLYECIIVARYVVQLQEEKEEKWRLSSMKSYTQVSRRDSSDAFMHPSVSYPYADKEHSYGGHNAA